MRKKGRYRWLPAVLLVFVCCRAGAQGVFAWRATADTVSRDGFYQILLTPEVVAKCRADLGDLRILGPGNRFVSYVLKDSWEGATAEKDRLTIPGAVMAQKDSSDQHSYVDLRFPEAYEVDWLSFSIRDPVFYKRAAEVFAEGANGAGWTRVTSITLAPTAYMVKIPSVKTRRLRVVVANADNAPLVINGAGGFQAARCLLAYLKAGMVYQVLAGNAQAAAPEYDLKYFTDSLTKTPPTLLLGPTEYAAYVNDHPAAPATKAKTVPGGHSGLLLWSILLAILILLIYFSVKMARVITQKEQHDRV
ncbi:MAG TPA: hypothetical protein VKQ52_07760 [Puia sp.]|nr:hypothetical protein [Puia sp.]